MMGNVEIPGLTLEADLRLLMPGGRLVRPARIQERRFSFLLPPGMCRQRDLAGQSALRCERLGGW